MVTLEQASRSVLEHQLLAWEYARGSELALLAVVSVAAGGAVGMAGAWWLTRGPTFAGAAAGLLVAVAVVGPTLASMRRRRASAWSALTGWPTGGRALPVSTTHAAKGR